MPDNSTPGTSPSVFVIVLNWNGWEDTIPCLKSLQDADYRNLQIVVVDNGSTDESVETIRLNVPGIPILETGRNLGFAGGNNFGIRYALENGADYVLVLNNDTIVPRDAITRLIDFAEKTPDAALIGPEISDAVTGEFLDLPMLDRINVWSILLTKSPIQRLIRGRNLYKRFFYRASVPGRVYSIFGCAMLFRESTLRHIEMFDEKTFIYWEEFIIAERLRRTGLQTYVVPGVKIIHKGNASISKIGAFKFLENMKSEEYFFRNYLALPFAHRFAINTVRFTGYMGRSVVHRDYRKHMAEFLRLLFNGQSRATTKHRRRTFGESGTN